MVIEGLIYDQSTGQPIAGATIRYIVIHSYYLEIQEGRVKETTSNKEGRFSLPMIVHDTDNIHLRVEADTFSSYEEKLDLFGDRGFSIGLTPSELATGSAP